MLLHSLKKSFITKFDKKKINKKGFTIIELLVVISIIGLLSTISVVSLNGARIKSRDAKRVSDIQQLKTAIELYFNDKGEYPISSTPITLGTGNNLVLCDGGFKASSSITNCPEGKIYMGKVPKNPGPNGMEYTYSSITSTDNFNLAYSLEKGTSSLPAGHNVLSSGGNNIPIDTINQGLIAHYPLNGTYLANDIIGGNNGTLVNSPTVDVDGITFASSSFQHINMGNVLNVATGEFTISAWIKSTGISQRIFSKKIDPGAGAGYEVGINTNGQVYLRIGDGAAYQLISPSGWIVVNDNNWHLATVSYNVLDNKFRVYADGAVYAITLTRTIGSMSNSTNVYIGRLGTGYFNGSISNIRVYNRALSDSEISLLYAQGK